MVVPLLAWESWPTSGERAKASGWEMGEQAELNVCKAGLGQTWETSLS